MFPGGESSIDMSKIRYMQIIKLEGSEPVVSIPYEDVRVDPDLVAGFVSAVITFANTPVRTIRKTAYDILIEVGDTMMVLLVLDPIPDERPYRERMIPVLDLVENGFNFNAPHSECEFFGQSHWIYQLHLQNLLSQLGIDWVGLLDGNPKELVDSIKSLIESPVDDEDSIRELVFSVLCTQIDRGGPTINLNIHKMTEVGDLAKRISRVLELRANEMNNLILHQAGRVVDLEPLWLTVYGYQLLRSMNLRKLCTIEKFEEIAREFRKLGFMIQISTNQQDVQEREITNSLTQFVRFSSESELVVDLIRRIGENGLKG